MAKDKLKLSPTATQKLRLVDVYASRVLKYPPPTEPISTLTDHGSVFYIEEVPAEEVTWGPKDRLIPVFHFAKDPNRPHSVPFNLVLHAGETVDSVNKRLQARLSLGEKEYGKVKLFLVGSGNRIKELENGEDVIGDMPLEPTDALALDHPDRAAAAKRSGGFEKSIKIHN